jgi:hypothetical protein
MTRAPDPVVENSQEVYCFFTSFHFSASEKSVRKCNKVKFLGFSAIAIALSLPAVEVEENEIFTVS